MKGLVAGFLSGALLVAAGLAGAQSGDEIEIRIGHVAPLTGGIAHLGKDNENGARLAIEEANAANLKIGGRSARFVLVAEDDQADPKVGLMVARKLVNANVVGVVGHLNSGTSIPAGQMYNGAGIPAITGSATNPRLTELGYRGQFRLLARDDAQGGAIGRVLAAFHRFRTFAVVDDGTAYGEETANQVAQMLQSLGRQVVVRFSAAPSQRPDWRQAVAQVVRAKPDAIFIGGMDNTGGPFMRQARDAGARGEFFMADGGCTNQISQASGGAAEGMFCTQAGIPPSMVGSNFEPIYRQRFGASPILYAPFTYDATVALIRAMLKADSAEPARYLPELAQLEFTGVTGRIAFDAKGDRKNAEVTVFVVREGRLAIFAMVQGERVMSPADFVAALQRLRSQR